MNDTRVTLAALLTLSVLAAGCAKTRTTLPPPPVRPNPVPQVAADPAVRVQTLARLADVYARTSNQLPGGNSGEHRKLMAEIFAQLEEILPILEGPNPGAEFRQQMQVIRDAQSELASGPQDLSSDPTIDTGLRAARDALSSIATGEYYDQATLTPLLAGVTEKINELDTVRGPLHQVITGEAVGQSSRVITAMADAMSKRMADSEQQPATAPAAVAPATAPSPTEASGK